MTRLLRPIILLASLGIFLLPGIQLGLRSAEILNANNADVAEVAPPTHPLIEISYSPDDARQARLFKEPIISVTFDDGWQSIYQNGLQILEDHHIDSTQYVLSHEFDHPLYMSEEQMRAFQRGGHQIASHTVTHADLTTLEPEALEYELTESRKELEKHFGGEITDFAVPLNRYNQTVVEAVMRHYRSHRTTDGPGYNVSATFDVSRIKAFTIRNTTTLEELRALIAENQAQNGWLVLNYHGIDDSGDEYSVAAQTLQQHLAEVVASGAAVMTVGEVLDQYEASNVR